MSKLKIKFNEFAPQKSKRLMIRFSQFQHTANLFRQKMSKFFLYPRLSLREQSLFAKRLSLLSQAGIPLLESINMLKRQSSNSAKKMFDEISCDVSNGQFLSKSILKHRRVFGDFAVNIIRIGETSGTFSENLKYLSEEIDKKRKIKGAAISAFIYPIIIMSASFGICGFLILYLFPKLMPIFKSMRMTLPITTRTLIWFSSFLTKYGLWLILALALSIAVSIIILRYKTARLIFDRLILKIPIFGELIQYYNLTNMCRTLAILLKSGIRVLEAIRITADASSILPYKTELHNLKIAVARGSNIAGQLGKNQKLFPSMLIEMVAVGEKTGNLSETLSYLAGIFEQELNEKTKRLSSAIEPTMMLGMGLIVGFIAISIISPIYEITQHIQYK